MRKRRIFVLDCTPASPHQFVKRPHPDAWLGRRCCASLLIGKGIKHCELLDELSAVLLLRNLVELLVVGRLKIDNDLVVEIGIWTAGTIGLTAMKGFAVVSRCNGLGHGHRLTVIAQFGISHVRRVTDLAATESDKPPITSDLTQMTTC